MSDTALDTIIPAAHTKTFNGVAISLRPFKVGVLPRVLAAAQPLAHMLTLREKVDIPSLFMLHADSCLELLAALANQQRSFVDELEVDDAINLLRLLLEANLDFFVQKVLPATAGLVKNLADVMQTQALAQTKSNI
ncbi:MAG: hypothetical protein K2P84_00075 [Undibacterium sp.]|nr:hypothetical protein [Undibacterium sp.]